MCIRKTELKMRMSCNGCRVLRKACNEDCNIKPCLEWIKTCESQSNATLFLSKFYGRAGLVNLVNAAPVHLRPATFRSLLYESCGRMVNPIYGSVGLLWSGQWHLCQEAVEAVLKGTPIIRINDVSTNPPPVIKGANDIRHITKDQSCNNSSDSDRRIKPNKPRFKRASRVLKSKAINVGGDPSDELNRSITSHDDSSVSHPNDTAIDTGNSNSSCRVSIETIEGNLSNGENELELELTLGLGISRYTSKIIRSD